MSTFRSITNDIVKSCFETTRSIDQVGEWPLVKHIQRQVLGRQQMDAKAAVLIETPQSLQPGQSYSIRMHITGRNEAHGSVEGIGALVKGDPVHIEIRMGRYANTAPVVQQADVYLPGSESIAIVTLPMQQFSTETSGRRERLHIFFMNETCQPLYTRPFAVDIFVSPLIRYGREGRTVLRIPW